MLLALLAVLGVDLVAILALAAFVFTVIRVKTGEAAVEVAAHSDDAELLPGPYSEYIGATLAATTTPTVAVAGSEGG